MELNVATDFLGTNELLCDTTAEQPVEGEFTIPDYQPEIFKIVKTKAEPVVVQKLAVGSRATVDGYVRLAVIYQSGNDKRLFSLVQKLPFSKQIELKEVAGENSWVLCHAAISYLNCRAINQRRIDVRGAVNLAVKVLSGAGSEFVSDLTGEGAQQRQATVEYVRQIAAAEKQFTLDEDLAVDLEGVQTPSLLRCDAKAYAEQVAIEGGHAVVGGTVNVAVALDVSDADAYCIKRAAFNLPFNQVVDLENVKETSRPVAHVSVLSCGAELGNDGAIEASILLAIEVRAYEAGVATLVSDAFSTQCELNMARDVAAVTHDVSSVWNPVAVRQTVSKPVIGARLIDYFVTVAGVNYGGEQGAKTARISAVFSYLLCDAGEDIVCWDHPFEFDVDVDATSGMPYTMLDVVFGGLECSETEDTVTLKAEGHLYGTVVDVDKQAVVQAVSADLSRPKTRPDMALAIYYADEGEDLFEIAKTFSTSPLEIMQENNMDDGILEQKSMMLIPIVE